MWGLISQMAKIHVKTNTGAVFAKQLLLVNLLGNNGQEDEIVKSIRIDADICDVLEAHLNYEPQDFDSLFQKYTHSVSSELRVNMSVLGKHLKHLTNKYNGEIVESPQGHYKRER